MRVRWNLNFPMTIQLTPYGRRIWEDDIKAFEGLFGRPAEHMRRVDTSKPVTLQGWEVMQLFGHYLGNGMPLPFEPVVELDSTDPVDAVEVREGGG